MSGNSPPKLQGAFPQGRGGKETSRGGKEAGRGKGEAGRGTPKAGRGAGETTEGNATGRRLFQSSSDFATISFGGHSERKHRLAPRQAKSPLLSENTVPYGYVRGLTVRINSGKFTNLSAATCNRLKEMHESYLRHWLRWKTTADDLHADRLAANRTWRLTNASPLKTTCTISSLSCVKYQRLVRSSGWATEYGSIITPTLWTTIMKSMPVNHQPQSLRSRINFASIKGTVTGVPYSPRSSTNPPHKLSAANLRLGLRPMDFWREVVQPDRVPTEEPEKSRYHAERLVGSTIVQEFHVMIQEGLEYSYLTNGLMDVQLWVPYDDPTTLYYHLGDPGIYGMAGVAGAGIPRTRIERTLCLCLMSFHAPLRDQAWRNAAKDGLPKWRSILDSDRAQIVLVELPRDLDVDGANSESASPEQSTSEYLTSSSPITSGPRVTTRAAASCAPLSGPHHHESSSDSEADPTSSAGRKRGFSQVTSSPPTQRSAPRADRQGKQSGQSRSHDAPYCTQKCLLGLQQGGTLDPKCPNTELHMLGGRVDRHPIGAADLVKRFKMQLDQDLDHNCTPIGPWDNIETLGEVSREAEVYRVLQRAQGSAVPVFLGAINLAQTYFLHGAGRIRHMLLMGWGGESVGHTTPDKTTQRAICRSVKEIRRFGVVHQDLRPENILWNAELQRALIIDFHLCTLDRRPLDRRPGTLKRLRYGSAERHSKRVRVVV
ncbi:hypothetical protein N7497_001094 [Penicillium chrysogenum]|nr:hypothetical protein N7497_001094 [Penicillium chrysogenum]